MSKLQRSLIFASILLTFASPAILVTKHPVKLIKLGKGQVGIMIDDEKEHSHKGGKNKGISEASGQVESSKALQSAVAVTVQKGALPVGGLISHSVPAIVSNDSTTKKPALVAPNHTNPATSTAPNAPPSANLIQSPILGDLNPISIITKVPSWSPFSTITSAAGNTISAPTKTASGVQTLNFAPRRV